MTLRGKRFFEGRLPGTQPLHHPVESGRAPTLATGPVSDGTHDTGGLGCLTCGRDVCRQGSWGGEQTHIRHPAIPPTFHEVAEGGQMSSKSRTPVVVGAILIQLCLGAIYAWSVFTPSLVLPLEDTNFEDDEFIGNNTRVILEGDLIDDPAARLNQETDVTVRFDGDIPTGATVSVLFELRDNENEPVDEVESKGETIYDRDDAAEDFTFTYPYTSASHTIEDVKLPTAGNWHVVITVDSVPDGEADILINEGITGDFAFTSTQTQAIFATGLAFFGVFTIVGGRMMPRVGPRNTALAGGAMLGLGYILGGLMGHSFMSQLIFIGVIGGIGIGLGYVVPIAVGIKWFPDKKGLISGVGVAGFGAGAMLWVQLAKTGGLIASLGVLNVFLIYGIAFAVLVSLGALVMVDPPEGYRPKGWTEPDSKGAAASASGGVGFTSGQMLHTGQFWMIWTTFCFGALAGLMVIGNIALFGIQALENSGIEAKEAAGIAAVAISILSIANGAGRIVWGLISDRIGRRKAIGIMSFLQGLMMLIFFSTGSNPLIFIMVATVIGFNFGGNFALFPAITADYFGNKSLGKNYGFTFSSYAVGGIAGPILGGFAAATAMGYAMAFYPAAVLCLLGAVLAFTLRPPKAPAGGAPSQEGDEGGDKEASVEGEGAEDGEEHTGDAVQKSGDDKGRRATSKGRSTRGGKRGGGRAGSSGRGKGRGGA